MCMYHLKTGSHIWLQLNEQCLNFVKVLLLLLSRFSRVQLCETPETADHQAPQSLGFSRQEHWSGLPFPSPMHESEEWKWSCSVMSDSQQPHGLQPTRLLRPWDFPGKSTGVECHCLLHVKVLGISVSSIRNLALSAQADRDFIDLRKSVINKTANYQACFLPCCLSVQAVAKNKTKTKPKS